VLDREKSKILFLHSQHQNSKLEVDHNPSTLSTQDFGAQRIDTGWEGLGRRIENKTRRFYDAFDTYSSFQYSRTRLRSEKLLDNNLTDASKTGAKNTINMSTHVTTHSRKVNGSSIRRTNDMTTRETNNTRLWRRQNTTLRTISPSTNVTTYLTTNGSSNTQEQEIEESRNSNAVLYKFKGELAIWRPEYLKDCTSNGLTMQRDTDIAGGFTSTKLLAY
jgi:hypothetical protein